MRGALRRSVLRLFCEAVTLDLLGVTLLVVLRIGFVAALVFPLLPLMLARRRIWRSLVHESRMPSPLDAQPPLGWPPRACYARMDGYAEAMRDDGQRAVATVQSVFYIATGLWPLVHRRSFERVTGPKVDFWLVETVGITVASIGLGLAQSLRSGRPIPSELRSVAIAAAAGLAAVDLVYVARRRISPVYLLDATAEAALIVGWLRG